MKVEVVGLRLGLWEGAETKGGKGFKKDHELILPSIIFNPVFYIYYDDKVDMISIIGIIEGLNLTRRYAHSWFKLEPDFLNKDEPEN